MKNLSSTILAITILGSSNHLLLAEEDPTFEISAFIVGIQGQGFVGDQQTGEGDSWEFPEGFEGSMFTHDIEDTPVDFEAVAVGPNGSGTYGHASCHAQADDVSVTLLGSALGAIDGGEDDLQYAESYAQMHGEFHISILEPAKVEFELCNETGLASSWGKLYIRKLVNGNFQTLEEHVTSSNQGEV